ncbi:MAG: CDP-glycerol glycerophosphotransferase family protein [Clostridium sp.]|nr:CDP-glycerol glycerophosphotransferase family protein [Clostridium sp.]
MLTGWRRTIYKSHIYQFFLRGAKKLYRFYSLRIMYPRLYKKHADKEIDREKVVFIEVRMPEISDNFRYIYDELKNKYTYKISTHFLHMSFSRWREYEGFCKKMVADVADAKYVFLNDASNVFSCLPLRKETVVTQLWHACGAFKKFGMSIAELKFGDDKKTLGKYPYHGNYTHVTVSSPEVVWAYEEAMNVRHEENIVKPVGISRTDIFYDPKMKKLAFDRLYSVFPQARGKKIILYAPTFRGRVASAKTPNEFDMQMMSDALGKEYVMLFKHHPFVKNRPMIDEEFSEFARDVTEELSIEDLLFVSDICISDYSSLVFEYSLFERPMIFFAYDLEDYFDWRGFYFKYDEFVPGPICESGYQVMDYIKHIDTRFDKEQVRKFKEKYMSACDGHSTERIIKLTMGDTLEEMKVGESI